MKRISILFISLSLSILSFAQTQLLPELVYSTQPAVIKGKVTGMTAANRIDSLELVCSPSWSTDDFIQKIKLNADGSYEAKFDVGVTSIASIVLGPRNQKMLAIVPGQEVIANIDLATSFITCEGAMSALNKSLANYHDQYREQTLNASINGNGIYNLKGFTVTMYRDKLIELYNEAVRKLNADNRLSPEYRELMIPLYQYLTVALMGGFDKILRYANQGGTFTKPDNYYEPVKDWNFTSKNGFLYFNSGTAIAHASQLNQTLGIKFPVPGSARKSSAAKTLASSIEQLHPLSDAQIASISTDCPEFKTILLRLNDEAKAKIAENEKNEAFKIKSISESIAGEDIFKAIVKDYRGKKVLVDFWATWCGPCKAAMKTILPVKEELWGKVAFVYVTGETSPKALWNKTIPDIHGDHFYVTASQWDALLKQFGVQGIPAYVVVDEEGNVVTKHIGYPGNETMLKELK